MKYFLHNSADYSFCRWIYVKVYRSHHRLKLAQQGLGLLY